MTLRFIGGAVVAAAVLWSGPAAGQRPAAGQPAYSPRRTADGQPDLQGFWRTFPIGSCRVENLEFHWIHQEGRPNPDMRGKSRIVDPPDGKIPYQPWAAARAKMIFDNHLDPTPETINPDARCFLQGAASCVQPRIGDRAGRWSRLDFQHGPPCLSGHPDGRASAHSRGHQVVDG